MYKVATTIPHQVQYIKVEKRPVKLHSNLYVYNGDVEFTAMITPTVGGYIIFDPVTKGHTFMAEQEFQSRYQEQA